jgi:bifunctional enzyme CysN/CysC
MPFRFPVQWVNRPNPDFRGYAGTIVSGAINARDPIAVANSGQTSIVKQLTREHLATDTLGLNDIAFCNLATGAPVAFDSYERVPSSRPSRTSSNNGLTLPGIIQCCWTGTICATASIAT